MSDQVGWGVLGTASIGREKVIPAIGASSNGKLRAIGSRSLAHARAVAEQHHGARAYGSYGDVLADDDVDAVYIPLPNSLHLPWTLRALEAGKHVLCEKPLGLDADEASTMASAAEAADRLLLEAFMWRFHPRARRVKQLIADGAIGEARLIRAALCFAVDDPTDIRFQPELGGGVLLDAGAYGVNAARWIFDAEPISAQALAVYGSTGVDVLVAGVLSFDAGRLASIDVSDIAQWQGTFSIVGTEGAIDLPSDAWIPLDAEPALHIRTMADKAGRSEIVPGGDVYGLMVEHFADAVLGGTSLAFSPQDSVANMRALDALAVAAREQRRVELG
jgi:predicted dehydrogenase